MSGTGDSIGHEGSIDLSQPALFRIIRHNLLLDTKPKAPVQTDAGTKGPDVDVEANLLGFSQTALNKLRGDAFALVVWMHCQVVQLCQCAIKSACYRIVNSVGDSPDNGEGEITYGYMSSWTGCHSRPSGPGLSAHHWQSYRQCPNRPSRQGGGRKLHRLC